MDVIQHLIVNIDTIQVEFLDKCRHGVRSSDGIEAGWNIGFTKSRH